MKCYGSYGKRKTTGSFDCHMLICSHMSILICNINISSKRTVKIMCKLLISIFDRKTKNIQIDFYALQLWIGFVFCFSCRETNYMIWSEFYYVFVYDVSQTPETATNLFTK